MKISILGSGSWGTAMGKILAINGHNVVVWTRDEKVKDSINTGENPYYLPGITLPKNLKAVTDINESINNSEIIVLAIPSQAVRSVIQQINYNNQIIVNLSKGIEIETGYLMSDVVKEVLKNARYCTLSGPSHAEEVARDVPTSVVISGKNENDLLKIQKEFSNVSFRIYTNNDLKGVEVSGAVKNIYAIASGVIDGMGNWDNTKAALITRATVEMARIGEYFGGIKETYAGLAGIGDLIVTCTSQHSRNRYVGEQLGRGKKIKEILDKMNMVAEGIYTVKAVHNIANRNNIEMPIAEKLFEVIYNNIDPKKAMHELMTRRLKSE
ncbi:MAG: NAD(P)H-dependent glycerol-3-phosphate dehydrogenase [Thermotogota bacterium]